MKYIADLHVHSSFSMATSKFSNLEGYYRWAKVKGIGLVGTGDFTHPGWYGELQEKLQPAGNGFFSLKETPSGQSPDMEGIVENGAEVSFCLTSEISSIYKKHGETHKVHSIIFAPDLAVVSRINNTLDKIGNIRSDGRPILGLDPKRLLEIIKAVSLDAELIPAHVWTPWFSVFGSASGFDSIEECFEDLSGEIFALETGLSSDPSMNWKLSSLDKYSLVSNSDAHSPQKLGREANVFDTEFSYAGMFRALRTGEGFRGTYEFYPEEGKYHLDGHRKCGVCLDPAETVKAKGECPVCGKQLTIGVLHRVTELSDRSEAKKPERAPSFRYIIPLPEVIAEITGKGATSKIVQAVYAKIVNEFGSEFSFLVDVPVDDAGERCGPVFKEALSRMRSGRIHPKPGYDGEFGVIRIFSDDELSEYKGQKSLFELGQERKGAGASKATGGTRVKKNEKPESSEEKRIDEDQGRVLVHEKGSMLILAGPGSGKTRTLVSWVEHLVTSGKADPHKVLAITFTNRAARELRERFDAAIGGKAKYMTVETFHGFAFNLVKRKYDTIRFVCDERSRAEILSVLFPAAERSVMRKLSRDFSGYFEGLLINPDPAFLSMSRTYIETLKKIGGIDISSIVTGINQIFKKDRDFLDAVRNEYAFIAVDELQDINVPQYELLTALFPVDRAREEGEDSALLAIGDPDQAIYGFRGSKRELFFKFMEEYSPETLELTRNYRSCATIVEGASSVISGNGRCFGAGCIPVRKRGRKISLFHASDASEEADFISCMIDELIGGLRFESVRDAPGNSWSFADIAILARTKAVLDGLSGCLRKRSIPYHVKTESSFATLDPFAAIVSILSYIENDGNAVALMKILRFLLCGTHEEEIDSLLAGSCEDRGLFAAFSEKIDAKIHEREREKLAFWSAYTGVLEELLAEKGISYVIKNVIETYPELDPRTRGYESEKESFLSLAEEYEKDVSGFVRRCGLDVHEDETLYKADKVTLLTFHASKGLEFPVVFMAGAEEGITPLSGKATDLEEERRLFYVAMTRAKDRLVISHSSNRLVFAENKEMERSRFVNEICPGVIENARNPAGRSKKAGDLQPLLFE